MSAYTPRQAVKQTCQTKQKCTSITSSECCMLDVRQEKEAEAKTCWISFYRVSRTSRKPWAVRHSCASHSTAQQSNNSGLRAAQRNGFFHVTPGVWQHGTSHRPHSTHSSTAWRAATVVAMHRSCVPQPCHSAERKGRFIFGISLVPYAMRSVQYEQTHARARSLAVTGERTAMCRRVRQGDRQALILKEPQYAEYRIAMFSLVNAVVRYTTQYTLLAHARTLDAHFPPLTIAGRHFVLEHCQAFRLSLAMFSCRCSTNTHTSYNH